MQQWQLPKKARNNLCAKIIQIGEFKARQFFLLQMTIDFFLRLLYILIALEKLLGFLMPSLVES